MTGLYLFCLIVGLPLLVWMAIGGDADGGDGLSLDVDGEGPLIAIPLSAIAVFMAVFGAIGLVGQWTDTAVVFTFVLALIVAVGGGWASGALLRWAGADDASSEVADYELEGTIAQVALPVSRDHRGKIILDIAGAREQMTASPAGGSTIDAGERVVVVRIEGGVALVAPLGPDYELE
ncbi:MAG: NfeD family protein [Acidimicrobiales bacterium]|jgi:membrane protein implicated in regulation of membrane protease activity|nr:NfeD family protein [Acidimicrobiales bacterium]